MSDNEKKFTRISTPERTRRMVETIFACKWSLTILTLIVRHGINRPGAIVRSVEGLTPKVMNFCLSKLVEFTILEKKIYPEVPPRVEYLLTPYGKRFLRLFEVIEELETDFDG